MLLYAVTTISLALVFYTIGVWAEKLQGSLKRWHLILFWIGFLFDTIGTSLMARLTNDVFMFNFHGITGMIAIALMLVHAVWATIVLIKNEPAAKQSFHKLSIIVWIVWLVPFVSGMVFGMMR